MNVCIIDDIIEKYASSEYVFKLFMNAVVDSFKYEPSLNNGVNPAIHTIKYRLKDKDHLRDKILRKSTVDDPITPDNLFSKITDLAGVRVLHLYQGQLTIIHKFIQEKVDSGDWFYREDPIAYSWDPESEIFFDKLGIESKIKDSYYTSIHYVVKPKLDSNVYCEIQVRTLFEEVWGEIDHTINYPTPTNNFACKEQLRVLSKLVSTGTRLADSIFNINNIGK